MNFVPAEDALSVDKLMHLMRELKDLAEDMTTKRVAPVKVPSPYHKLEAILVRNIKLFFKANDLGGVCPLYAKTKAWTGPAQADGLQCFRLKLLAVVKGWHYRARHHPRFHVWHWSHHMNVINVWSRYTPVHVV